MSNHLVHEITVFADFETTVENDTSKQTRTEVWSGAWCLEGMPDDYKSVHVDHSIDDFMNSLMSINACLKVYFHNLKFDGTYILTWLFTHGYKQAFDDNGAKTRAGLFGKNGLQAKEFTYAISDKGTWYTITMKYDKFHYIKFWDSLKIAPGSLASLAKAFKTKHQKLTMTYKGKRYAGCKISNKEMKYIKNDILAMKEVLELMHAKGLTGLTIGSECMKEFKAIGGYTDDVWDILFPDLTTMKMPDVQGVNPVTFSASKYDKNRTYDSFIRRSYHGGFCYCNPKFAGKRLKFVSHADANSHYPSMMHSNSGNYYPTGTPTYVEGKDFDKIKDEPEDKGYYFVRFQCAFLIRDKKIPMVQIKDDLRFAKRRNEWLSDSDGYVVDLVMTCTDFRQFMDSYVVDQFRVIEAVNFTETAKGLFDDYIEKWMQTKMTAKGALRQIAKLFLNNLYGQFSKSRRSDYKVLDYIPGKGLRYRPTVTDNHKKPGFIAIGSAITSYARHYTEMIAQNNYDYFVYADTDSVVMIIPESQIKGLPIDPVKLCYWKVESNSDDAIFVRQKTYIEHVTHEDGKPISDPYYNIKCAGMGKEAKENLSKALINCDVSYLKVSEDTDEGEQTVGFTLDDFKPGLIVNGNLRPKNIDGGILLMDKFYKMR